MRTATFALAVSLMASGASAQQMAAYDGYRVCPADQTTVGLNVVEETCGRLRPPTLEAASFSSLDELRAAEAQRERFTTEVSSYGSCITQFINSYRRPGAPADSDAPDQAACAHSWAEDQATKVVIEYGRACIDFSNRSMMDPAIEPWSGSCYPEAGSGQG